MTIFITLIRFVMRFVCPFLIPILLLFAKDVQDTINPKGQAVVPRKKLPDWLKWFDTPDQTLPAGLYEPTMLKIYNIFGSYITAWVWLGFRNVMFGLLWAQGREIPKAMWFMSEDELKAEELYKNEYKFLIFKWISGYSCFKDYYSVSTKDKFWVVKGYSLRFIWQD